MNPRASRQNQSTHGMTLLELLISLAGTSALMTLLCLVLDSSSRQFTQSSMGAARQAEAQALEHWLQKDMRNLVFSDRVLSQGRSAGFVSPFEATRRSGLDQASSLPNADPHYDSLCYVVSGGYAEGALSIVAYYVAWTYDSPLQGNSRMSMKLFRHYRPSEHLEAVGHSAPYLQAFNSAGTERLSLAENRSQVSNRELPFLLEWGDRMAGKQAVKPWPLHLVAQPMRGPPRPLSIGSVSQSDWENPHHLVHQNLFPDEPLVKNVVAFEAIPYRLSETNDGKTSWLNGTELNAMLGNRNGDEWPCLVAPDKVEVRLVTVDDVTANRLASYEDWSQFPQRSGTRPGTHIFQFNIHLRREAR